MSSKVFQTFGGFERLVVDADVAVAVAPAREDFFTSDCFSPLAS